MKFLSNDNCKYLVQKVIRSFNEKQPKIESSDRSIEVIKRGYNMFDLSVTNKPIVMDFSTTWLCSRELVLNSLSKLHSLLIKTLPSGHHLTLSSKNPAINAFGNIIKYHNTENWWRGVVFIPPMVLEFDLKDTNAQITKEYYFKSQDDILSFSINTPSKIAILGDSIGAGTESLLEGGYQTSKALENIFITNFGCTVNTLAKGGNAYCLNQSRVNDRSTILNQVRQLDGDEDLVLIIAGTNDSAYANASYGLGSNIDTTSDTTFYGSLFKTCEELKDKCPNTTVVLVSPIRKYNYYAQHMSLEQVRDAIYFAANKYGFAFINGDESPFPRLYDSNTKHLMADYIHPTKEGYELLSTFLYSKIRQMVKTSPSSNTIGSMTKQELIQLINDTINS